LYFHFFFLENERDVPTKPQPVSQVSLEQSSQREEASKGNTRPDDKENSQPKEKPQDSVPESPRVYRM
jgi:hypothetical protein